MISLKKAFLLLLLFSYKVAVIAQCAMCKATLESDLAAGGSAGKGINNGIIYLMIFPYLLFGVVGYFIFKHYQKNKSKDKK